MAKSVKAGATTQHRSFIETARELGCDEDEDAFKERLKKLTSAPPKHQPSKPKAKKAK